MGTGLSEMPLSPVCRTESSLTWLWLGLAAALPDVEGLELLKRSTLHFNN